MPPKTIYIIRHCDKPANSDEEGLNHPLACLCSTQGYLRADLLPKFWKKTLKNSIPSAMYASNFSPDDPKCDCEQREMLVLVPTSNYYNIPIQKPYCFTQINEISTEILKNEGIVVVAWEHHHIPILANTLGVKDVIGNWPDDRFDIVFKLERNSGNSGGYGLTMSTEELGLNGDSNNLPKDYRRFGRFRREKVYIFIILVILVIFAILFTWLPKNNR